MLRLPCAFGSSSPASSNIFRAVYLARDLLDGSSRPFARAFPTRLRSFFRPASVSSRACGNGHARNSSAPRVFVHRPRFSSARSRRGDRRAAPLHFSCGSVLQRPSATSAAATLREPGEVSSSWPSSVARRSRRLIWTHRPASAAVYRWRKSLVEALPCRRSQPLASATASMASAGVIDGSLGAHLVGSWIHTSCSRSQCLREPGRRSCARRETVNLEGRDPNGGHRHEE